MMHLHPGPPQIVRSCLLGTRASKRMTASGLGVLQPRLVPDRSSMPRRSLKAEMDGGGCVATAGRQRSLSTPPRQGMLLLLVLARRRQ